MPELLEDVAAGKAKGKEVKVRVVITLLACGVMFLLSAVVSLVMIFNVTGPERYYWSFQAVLSIVAMSLLVTAFTLKR